MLAVLAISCIGTGTGDDTGVDEVGALCNAASIEALVPVTLICCAGLAGCAGDVPLEATVETVVYGPRLTVTFGARETTDVGAVTVVGIVLMLGDPGVWTGGFTGGIRTQTPTDLRLRRALAHFSCSHTNSFSCFCSWNDLRRHRSKARCNVSHFFSMGCSRAVACVTRHSRTRRATYCSSCLRLNTTRLGPTGKPTDCVDADAAVDRASGGSAPSSWSNSFPSSFMSSLKRFGFPASTSIMFKARLRSAKMPWLDADRFGGLESTSSALPSVGSGSSGSSSLKQETDTAIPAPLETGILFSLVEESSSLSSSVTSCFTNSGCSMATTCTSSLLSSDFSASANSSATWAGGSSATSSSFFTTSFTTSSTSSGFSSAHFSGSSSLFPGSSS
uniref:Secreted protein n=1 Tax=Rhipicephalus appendiculatus TaxID=34631 RepID=A0A131YCY9_RHIAP